MLGTDIEVHRKGFVRLNILQPLITLWKLGFKFFVERLGQLTAAQFGISKIKQKQFFRYLTSTFIKTWNMRILFSMKYSLSQKSKHFML